MLYRMASFYWFTSSLVYFVSMTNRKSKNNQSFIFNRANKAVIPDAISPLAAAIGG